MAIGPVVSSLDNSIAITRRLTGKLFQPGGRLWGAPKNDQPRALLPGESREPIKALPNLGTYVDVMA